jgi:hypothetical protein
MMEKSPLSNQVQTSIFKQEYIDDFKSWAKSLGEPNKKLLGLPTCPYAANAKVDFLVSDLSAMKMKLIPFIVMYEINHTDVYVVIDTNPDWVSANRLEQWCDAYNEVYAYMDIYAMSFHPSYPPNEKEHEFLVDVEYESSNLPEYGMIFFQSLSELEKASIELEEKGYYRGWSKEYYEKLVGKRRELLWRVSRLG